MGKKGEEMMKKKLVASMVAIAMGASLTACGSSVSTASTSAGTSETVSESSEDTEVAASSTMVNCKDVTPDDSRENTSNSDGILDKVSISNTTEIAELQPYNVDDASKDMFIPEIYESLYDMYSTSDYEPRLATGQPVEIDDTHYQVTIYDYITDSDGNNITASDVAFSYDLAYNSGYGSDWDYYESAEAIDDYTVEFTFTQPLDSLSAFTNLFTKVMIVSEQAYNDHNMSTDPVGTGPYVLSDYVAGASLVMTKRDDYWQTDDLKSERADANVQEIEIDTVGDDQLSLVAMEEGDSDFRFMRDDYSMFEEGGEYADLANLYAHDSTQSHSILPNCSTNSPCSDKNLRLAIYYAIDNNAICQAISSATKFPSSVDVSALVSDYQSDWDTYALDTYQANYDPDLAKEYLEKSDYDGETLTILLESNDEKKLEAQLLQGYLSAIGINSEIEVYDHSVISTYEADPTYWDIFMYSGNANDYAISKWMTEYSAAQNNGTTVNFIDDSTFQDMLTQCDTLSGYSDDLTKQIGEYIIDNAYAYGTYYSYEIYAYSPKFASIYQDFWGTTIIGACDYYLDL